MLGHFSTWPFPWSGIPIIDEDQTREKTFQHQRPALQGSEAAAEDWRTLGTVSLTTIWRSAFMALVRLALGYERVSSRHRA